MLPFRPHTELSRHSSRIAVTLCHSCVHLLLFQLLLHPLLRSRSVTIPQAPSQRRHPHGQQRTLPQHCGTTPCSPPSPSTCLPALTRPNCSSQPSPASRPFTHCTLAVHTRTSLQAPYLTSSQPSAACLTSAVSISLEISRRDFPAAEAAA